MSIAVVGPLLDALGQARQRRHYMLPTGEWRTRRRQWATPSHGVRKRQASFIGVDLSHDRNWIGQVEHLERDAHGRLWCAAEIEDRYMPPSWLEPLYWSPSLVWNEGTNDDVEITSVAITDAPAQTGTLPLKFFPGLSLRYRGATDRLRSAELDSHRRALLERAASAHVHRAAGAPILVHDTEGLERDLDRLGPAERYIALAEQYDEAWQHRPLRHRPGRILAVR